MNVVILDGTTAPTKEALHQHLAKELNFPDWYGGNLDALFDMLGDITEDMDIIFTEDEEGSCGEWVVDSGSAMRSDEMNRLLKNVRRVIEDASEENSHLSI